MSKRRHLVLASRAAAASAALGVLMLCPNHVLRAEGPGAVASAGTAVRPPSSIARPGSAGVRAHTNVEKFVPKASAAPQPPPTSFYSR